MEEIKVNLRKTKTGFSADVDILPGVISTAPSQNECLAAMEQAIQMHLDGLCADNLPIPAIFKKEYKLIPFVK